ncbi:MAG: methyltransferase domain-containing protein [Patescibacteria group bacterium]|nr:methyltransferase domain-containing protein [Patescibacteria group bacterium]
MSKPEKIKSALNQPEGLEMYFAPEVAKKFAELEQNEKNFRVAQIVDKILMTETAEMKNPLRAVELGAGAHPDRYDEFFKKLLSEPKGQIDWVDVSPHMLDLAKKYIGNEKYKDRNEVVKFIQSDVFEYLRNLKDDELDLAIIKYTLDYLKDLKSLFELLAKKLKQGGKLVATVGKLNPELKSFSTNARYLYNGRQFPDDEMRILKDGDTYTVKFFKVSGDPKSGYLEGAEALEYFHSAEKIKEYAENAGLEIFLGDWKDFVDKNKQGSEKMDQDILVLTKK